MDYKYAGKQIKALRKKSGISQKQLGDAISRSESSIAKYEQGLVEIPMSTLEKISNFFNVDIISILGANQQPPALSCMLWLESLGYKVDLIEEEEYTIFSITDNQYRTHCISVNDFNTAVNNIESYSRFQMQELLNKNK